MTRWRDSAPGERESAERSWEVVRRAYAERLPAPRRRDHRPLLALAAGVVVLAAALSPPGLAVWGSLRDAVTSEDHLLALPTRGRVLVNAQSGVWVVDRDGSKRFLGGYFDASWSPHGLYLAAARRNDLVAMEPNGHVHWKLARARPIGMPRWSYDGFRIAYLAGRALRVVNGDGTGDRLISPNAVGSGLPALAWRPGTHDLLYTNGRAQLVLLDVDRNKIIWARPSRGTEEVAWSDDGRRLFIADVRPRILDASGRLVAAFGAGTVLPAAFVPHSRALALVRSAGGSDTVYVYSGARYARRRSVFSGAGSFGGIAWSPDARWLLVDWRTADQWLFIRSAAVRRIAVRNIGNTFDSGPEHYAALAGWCCP
jgi:hypothetical protein